MEVSSRKFKENAHDALAIGGLELVAGIQEKIVGRFLNLDEVRHFQHFADFAVVFTKTFLAKVGLSHVRCHLSRFSPGKGAVGPRHLAHTRQGVRINSWPPSQWQPPDPSNLALENAPNRGPC